MSQFTTQISVFKSLFNTDTPFTLSIEEVVDLIKNPRAELVKNIDLIKSMEDKKQRDEAKQKNLYAIMFNGTFSQRSMDGLIKHSGLCVLDFDGYPDEETLNKERQRFIDDEFTMIVFRSPSGRGLKSVIRIPESDKNEHIRRYNSYERYINSDYFDKSGKDVSRVCFEAYDYDLYFNPDCNVYEGIEDEVVKSYQHNNIIVPISSGDEIIERIMKWNFNLDFVEGERNNYIFMIAGHFCEYGVDRFSAESFIFSNFTDSSFTEREAGATIKSAYNKREFGKYFFEDTIKVEKIKNQIKQGAEPANISKELDVDVYAVEEIVAEVKAIEDNEVFWSFKVNNRGVEKIEIEPLDFVNWLEFRGYKKYFPENSVEPVLVHLNENKVVLTSEDKIRDFVKDEICSDFPQVYNHFIKQTGLLKPQTLNSLESIDLKMLQDEANVAYIPYKNGVAQVTKDKVQLMKYIEVDGYIWEAQILDRDFTYNEDYKNDFQDFISKVSDDKEDRIKALESVLGYLTHTYKSKTHQKAIIFNDEEISDVADGGSGKSLVMVAVSHFRRLVKIDGKKFDLSSDFAYQRVELDTQVLSFDDVKRNFNFESLFSLITEGIAVNKKNRDEIFIPFERSPKIVITTNYVINGTGSSHSRRRHEVEFNQYFNESRTPEDEYGRMMFDADSWDNEDWIKFDNYMIKNIQLFLNKGLLKVESINADVKRFIQSTSKDFYDFVQEGNIPVNVRLDNSQLFESFSNEFKVGFEVTPRIFQKWVSLYSRYKGFRLEKGKSNGKRYTELICEKKDEGLPF